MHYRIEKIGIHILAFMVARCQLLGMYPFVVPFFMAAYLQERSSISVFIVLLLGVLSCMDVTATIKYGLVMMVLLITLNRTNRKTIFATDFQIAIASGVFLWAVSMPYGYIVTLQDISLLYALLEGVIAACGVLVLQQGFLAFRVGTSRMFATNERFVGVFALMTIALFGCPILSGPVNLLFVLGGYLLLYYAYRFDGAVSLATGSVVGLVLSLRTEHVAWLMVMILLSSIMTILRELGKVGVLLGFLAGYLLLGVLYDPVLLSTEVLTSAVVILILFFVTPKSWMKRTVQVKDGKTAHSQDMLIQEITRNRIRDFGEAFLDMEKMLSVHEQDQEVTIPNGLSNMYLSGDGISLLNAVESQSNRLIELRRNFVRQLGQIGEVITSFQGEMDAKSVKTELFEERTTEVLGRLGVVVTKAVLVKDKKSRIEVHISVYLAKEKTVTGRMMAGRLGKMLSKRMICLNRGDDVVSRNESLFSFVEEGTFMLTTGIVRKKREGEMYCGDNFSVSKVDTQKAVLMISDGMGSGENAYLKSEQVVELLEKLLLAGFCRELAIELLNSFISFLADGCVSSTLDLTMIDLYTGIADFVKLGASTTFIKRKHQVECIRSTSLPVGVLEQIEFDTCARRLYDGDMIIMISDGVMDGVLYENKEAYLVELIASIETNNVQGMAEQIMEEVETMQRGTLRDDSTILVAGVWER